MDILWSCFGFFEEEEQDFTEKLKIRLNPLSFSKLYNDKFIPCSKDEKIVTLAFQKYFENGIPNYNLLLQLSKISLERRKLYEPEFFENRLSSIRFCYINEELVPYRYTLIKKNDL